MTVKRNDPYLCLLNTGGGNDKLGFHWYGTESGKNTLGIYDLKNKVHLLTIEQATKNAIFEGSVYTKDKVSAGDYCRMFSDGEGGALEVVSKSKGNTWQIDSYNGNLRFYTMNTSGEISAIEIKRSTGTIIGDITGNAATATEANHATTAESAHTATLATLAKFLGEGVNKYNTGNGVNPIYISNGLPTRSNETVGSADTPVYLNKGTITSTGKKFSDYLPLSGGNLTGNFKTNADSRAKYFIGLDTAYIMGSTESDVVRLCGSAIHCNNRAINANVAIYASAFSQTSSRRYKENIEDLTLEDAMKILDLRPVTYDYINKANGVNCQGLIAEEVDQVMKYPVIYNDEGQPDGLDYSKFVPSLIKLVQYQEKRIEELEKTVESLASKIG